MEDDQMEVLRKRARDSHGSKPPTEEWREQQEEDIDDEGDGDGQEQESEHAEE